MPVLVHNRADKPPLAVFESASILLYLARTFDRGGQFHFVGADEDDLEQEMLDWCMWQMANLGPAQGNVRRVLPLWPLSLSREQLADSSSRASTGQLLVPLPR